MKFINKEPVILEWDNSTTLRGILMLMIIVHHLFQHLNRTYDTNITLGQSWGHLCSGAFLFISGYGMFLSMSRQKDLNIRYVWAHVVKILVPFIIAFVVTSSLLPVFGIGYDYNELILDFFRINIPPEHEWFIKVLLMSYIFGYLSFKLPMGGVRSSLIFVLIAAYYLIAYYLDVPKWMFRTSPMFAFGMLYAEYKDQFTKKPYWLVAVIGFILYLVTSKIHLPFNLGTPIHTLAYTVAIVFLFSYVNIKSKILTFVGKKSLLFYLFHIGFLQLSYGVYIDSFVTLSISITLILLYVSVESYINSFIQKIS